MTISKSPFIIDFLRPTSWTKRIVCHATNILRTTSMVLKIRMVKELGKGVVPGFSRFLTSFYWLFWFYQTGSRFGS